MNWSENEMRELLVEYLAIVTDDAHIHCSDSESFNHLLQSNPCIKIDGTNLIYRKNGSEICVTYRIKTGVVSNGNKHYFHLTFECATDKIESFNELLDDVRSTLYLTGQTVPQILYDGVSLHYALLAYPKIFQLENLMRKLITKFMLINVGLEWDSKRIPNDMKRTNNVQKETTYLYNVDFDELTKFLTSENYPSDKDKVIDRLKKATDIKKFNLDEIKSLIPMSNWDKYFSQFMSGITQAKLKKEWDTLYEYRCKVAHNRPFSKANYSAVEDIYSELLPVINNAINHVDEIHISEQEGDLLTDAVVNSFDPSERFIPLWRALQNTVFKLVCSAFPSEFSSKNSRLKHRSWIKDLDLLRENAVIGDDIFFKIMDMTGIRHSIAGNGKEISNKILSELEELTQLLENIIPAPRKPIKNTVPISKKPKRKPSL